MSKDDRNPDIPQTAAAGVLVMTQPHTSTVPLYKIHPSEHITFAWSLSDVIPTVAPTSITIRVEGDNGYTYTIGPHEGTIDGKATSVVWNPYEHNQATPTLAFKQGGYRLKMWDDRGPGLVRTGGYMNEFSGLKFALYEPEPYEGLPDGEGCGKGCESGTLRAGAHPLAIALVCSVLIMMLGSGFTLLRRRR